jgi:hypothetical protein
MGLFFKNEFLAFAADGPGGPRQTPDYKPDRRGITRAARRAKLGKGPANPISAIKPVPF